MTIIWQRCYILRHYNEWFSVNAGFEGDEWQKLMVEKMPIKSILAPMTLAQEGLMQCIAAEGRCARWDIWKDLDVLRRSERCERH